MSQLAAYGLWHLGRISNSGKTFQNWTLEIVNEELGKNAVYAVLALDLLEGKCNEKESEGDRSKAELWAEVQELYQQKLGEPPAQREQGAIKIALAFLQKDRLCQGRNENRRYLARGSLEAVHPFNAHPNQTFSIVATPPPRPAYPISGVLGIELKTSRIFTRYRMHAPMTAIETTGTIDEHHRLHLDSLLPISGPKRVRVIVLSTLDDWEDINETEWLQAIAKNPSFEFLNDPKEDIYSLEDGKPFHDQV
jgi:hypothetical protein